MMLYLLLLEGWRQGVFDFREEDEAKQSALVVFVIALLSVCSVRGGFRGYATIS